MLELIYKYYFKLLSIRPLGAWDQQLRQFLGMLFNGASTKADVSTINKLARGRKDAISHSIEISKTAAAELPDIDVIMLLGANPLDLQQSFDCLEQQSYPAGKISLTVIQLEQLKTAELPQLPSALPHSRYIKIPKNGESLALIDALNNLKAPFFVVMAQAFAFKEHSLETFIQNCLADTPSTALWELSPTVLNRTLYYDPVTLELPCSYLQCGLVRREHYATVGGFDSRFPLSGQGLDLSYRLRSQGYQLKNPGHTNLFEQNTEEFSSGQQDDEKRKTHSLLQIKYGSWLQKIHGKLYSKIIKNEFNQSNAAIKPSRLWRAEPEISMGCATSLHNKPILKQPKASIIIRTYVGREYWLRESISSVLNQTYPHIELIVIEDGSKQYAGLIKQISASLKQGQTLKYQSQAKLGKSHAGNLGLENATGTYIGFLDDDDLLFPNHIEQLLNLLLPPETTAETTGETTDEAADGAYALAWEVRTANQAGGGYKELHFETPRITRQEFSHEVLKKHNIWPIQSVLFHRKLYHQYGGFNTDRNYLEDWDLWLRYTQETHFAFLPHVTSIYRTPADPYIHLTRISNPDRRTV